MVDRAGKRNTRRFLEDIADNAFAQKLGDLSVVRPVAEPFSADGGSKTGLRGAPALADLNGSYVRVNRTYAEMAAHYGTAILPARPYKPRDKAMVEVEDRVKHALYAKVIRRTTKLKVHDEQGVAGIGDRVQIMETRPMSRSSPTRKKSRMTSSRLRVRSDTS